MKYQERLMILIEIGHSNTKSASRYDETCIQLLRDAGLVRLIDDTVSLTRKGSLVFNQMKNLLDIAES